MAPGAKAPAPSGVRACERPRIDVTGIEAAVTCANVIGQLAAENEALRAELATRPTKGKIWPADRDPLLGST